MLAAQFGYLPGTIWIVFGVVLGGAVQDFVILFGSMRRDGKSLGQMAKEEIGPLTGLLAMVAVLAIMVILLAVLALVVVNALKDSPWGVFTIALHHSDRDPDGLLDEGLASGPDARGHRSIGVVLLLLALVGGPVRRGVADAGPALHPLGARRIAYGDDRLRLRRQRAAGVDAALPAGLSLAPS